MTSSELPQITHKDSNEVHAVDNCINIVGYGCSNKSKDYNFDGLNQEVESIAGAVSGTDDRIIAELYLRCYL